MSRKRVRVARIRCPKCLCWDVPDKHSEAWCRVRVVRQRMRRRRMELVTVEWATFLRIAGVEVVSDLSSVLLSSILLGLKSVEEKAVEGFWAPSWAVRVAELVYRSKLPPWRRLRIMRRVVSDLDYRERFLAVLSSLHRLAPEAVPDLVRQFAADLYAPAAKVLDG